VHWIPLTWYYYGFIEGREMAPGDRLRCEYLALSIIPTGSKPQRSTPFMVMGVLIALGAALLFVLGQYP
jgi:hypothetical protein